MPDRYAAITLEQRTKDSSVFQNNLKPDLTLIGNHANLEPMQLEHIGELNLAAADGELWNLTVTSVPDSHSMQEYVEKALANREKGRELPFIIRRQLDQKIVGSTRFYYINPANRNLSIGYTWHAQSAQRTGINTECKYMLLHHAFEVAGAISVQWHTYHGNTSSQAAIKRIGAKFEGVLRNHMILPDGRIRDTHCFSMLDSEWPEAKKRLSRRLERG